MQLTSKQVPLDQVQLFQWETLPAAVTRRVSGVAT